MDAVNVNSVAAATSQNQVGDAVGILTLKKAIQIQGQLAMQLISAIPAPPVNPPHLGQGVDVRA
ncbi:MAG: YjfB family protein [Zoogloeaceae bacterium]|jgi:hypothetical protein|nr:YjfB family protein [Zoogloeaceae bacterium]